VPAWQLQAVIDALLAKGVITQATLMPARRLRRRLARVDQDRRRIRGKLLLQPPG
jgi:hypothetical protein